MNLGYLVLLSGIGIVWLVLFLSREDIRQKMLWSGRYCVIVLSAGFFILRLLFPHLPEAERIVPGYWNPDTLFNLAHLTGGWSIEDALYMFFTGGIASTLYDVLFQTTTSPAGPVWRKRRKATLIAAVAVCVMTFTLHTNLIWELIVFCAVGALVLWISRPDLIMRSLIGGILYAALYYSIFLSSILFFFPDYLVTHYNLANLSGLMIGRLPLEEMCFAFFFALMWSPLYEYVKDIRSVPAV